MKEMLRIGLIACPLDRQRKQICNRNSEMARRYGEEFKRRAMELMIHSGKTQRQVARELDVSQYSLNLSKKGVFEPTRSGVNSSDIEFLAHAGIKGIRQGADARPDKLPRLQ